MPPKSMKATTVDDDSQAYENAHVHAVYNQIASHFSSTRYKPWPVIAKFMSDLPAGWIGLDAGTGNGKYLPLPLERPGSVCTIGLDRSQNLLEIAKMAGGKPRETVVGEILANCWRTGVFDYAISIATIHHLASPQRRKLAIKRLLECVSRTHGRILIFVWATEQDELSKRSVPKSGQNGNLGQDVFVPWSTTQSNLKYPADGINKTKRPMNETFVFDRYYHMFAEKELQGLVLEAAADLGLEVGAAESGGSLGNVEGIEIVQEGWDRSNYYVELRRWAKIAAQNN